MVTPEGLVSPAAPRPAIQTHGDATDGGLPGAQRRVPRDLRDAEEWPPESLRPNGPKNLPRNAAFALDASNVEGGPMWALQRPFGTPQVATQGPPAKVLRRVGSRGAPSTRTMWWVALASSKLLSKATVSAVRRKADIPFPYEPR